MNHAPESIAVRAVIVDETMQFTLVQLSQACRVDAAQLLLLVDEGVLEPAGSGPEDWRFAGPSLRRAHLALRLTSDLELSPAAAALVMDLLDEIGELKARLSRAGLG